MPEPYRAERGTVDRRNEGGVAAAVENFAQADLKGTELSAIRIRISDEKCAVGIDDGCNTSALWPATTSTRSDCCWRRSIMAPRNVLTAGTPSATGGQGSSALSRPMRVDAPAARMTPQIPAVWGMA